MSSSIYVHYYSDLRHFRRVCGQRKVTLKWLIWIGELYHFTDGLKNRAAGTYVGADIIGHASKFIYQPLLASFEESKYDWLSHVHKSNLNRAFSVIHMR